MSRRKRRRGEPHAEPARPEPSPPPLEIPTHRKLLYSALIFVVFFAGVEVLLALAGVRPILVEEDPYVGFASELKLFERSPDGGERRTAENKLALFNRQSFPTPKPEGTYRIFSVGGSTTYGRPFDDGTSFSGWLRRYLAAVAPGRSWEVINAGGISYGSYRVANLMEELVEYEPDLFVIYSGNNEFLERRTYSDLIEEPGALRGVRLLLQRTRLGSLMQRVAESSRRGERRRYELTGEVEELLDSSAGLDYYRRDEVFRRRVLEHYRFNLARMVRLARSRGAAVLLVSVPVNEKDFSPFKSQHRDGLGEAQRERHAALLAGAREALEAGDGSLARERASEAVELDPLHAEGHYLLGRALLAGGDAAAAGPCFERAIAEDVCPLRALPRVNALIAEVARAERVPLVDFRGELKRHARQRHGHELLGDEYFLDHVHPRVEANGILARELVDAVAELGVVDLASDWRDRVGPAIRDEIQGRVGPADYARAHKNLSKVLIWAGKEQLARQHVEAAAEVLADDWEVRYNAGVILADGGSRKAAVAAFREAIRLEPRAARAWDRLGSASAALGDMDTAVEAGERAVALRPEMAGAWNNLAVTYRAAGDPEKAMDAVREALRLEPDFAEAHHNLGHLHFDAGRLSEALESYDRALALRPGYAAGMVSRGLVLGQQGRHREALGAFSEALALEPRLPEAHLGRGKALLAAGDLAGARGAFARATALDPMSLEARELLARSLVTSGEREEARRVLLQGIERHPSPARLHHALGRLLAGEGEHAAAGRAFARALEAEPDLVEARLDLGRLRMVQGRHEEAIRVYRGALARGDSRAEVHHALATALLVEDRVEDGRRHLEQAVRLDPGNAAAARDLAVVYEHLGRLDAALELYREAARLDPGLTRAVEGARRLGGAAAPR